MSSFGILLLNTIILNLLSRSYGTVSEEDNDGGAPMYVVNNVFPNAQPELIPDVVIITEGTGDTRAGSVGIYRGQRGRMTIEVTVCLRFLLVSFSPSSFFVYF